MKGKADLITSIHHIKIAYDLMNSFIMDNPNTNGARMFIPYTKKLNWIVNDIITNPIFPQVVRDGIREEWESDSFTLLAIDEKLAKLSVDQRNGVEVLIEMILEGKKLIISHEETDSK